MTDNVVELNVRGRAEQLFDDIITLISTEKYEVMKVAEIVGVLEYLKWNLINKDIPK